MLIVLLAALGGLFRCWKAPKLTPEEIERMEALNPKSADERREEEEARRFLAAENAKPTATAPHKHDGKR